MAEKKEKAKKATGIHRYYKTNAGLQRTRRSCPKCGEGVFLGEHENRTSCGRCGYTEFKRK